MYQRLPFQIDRPIFVRIPFRMRGKQWNREQHLPWKEMNVDQEIVHTMYLHGQLYHSAEQETSMQVGDGLEALDSEGLKQIVDDYNARIKALGLVESQFIRRKCPSSRIADKQRGLLRSWRRNNLDWLNKSEANK